MGEPAANKKEVVVFAAASLTETLSEIGDLYRDEAPEVDLIFNFDSSGTLKTQIQEGAVCDIFISAGQKQMDQLEEEPDPMIDAATRRNVLENRVTLCVNEENRKGIESFDRLFERLGEEDILLGMGNSDVPVGQYTQKILDYYGLDEEKLAEDGKISYGSNVKEVTTQIIEGSVDCGVIYCTDAFSAGLTIVDYATKEMCGQVIYPAAVLNNAEYPEEAKAFLDFLETEEAMGVFEKVGFSEVADEP